MPKRTFSVSFKREVIDFIDSGSTVCAAVRHFSRRDQCEYDKSMFYQWYRQRKKLQSQRPSMKRANGGGRKTSLGNLEELLASEIVDLRIQKLKVGGATDFREICYISKLLTLKFDR